MLYHAMAKTYFPQHNTPSSTNHPANIIYPASEVIP
jgi:hypothetical protein